jgi:L-threonylcarbamoyladenylate synthase
MKYSSGTDVLRAISSLCERDVVVIPTETSYVLACNALDEEAVARFSELTALFPESIPELFVPNFDAASKYARNIPEVYGQLARRFSPGQLGYLLKGRYMISESITDEEGRMAVRVPAHPLTQQLLGRIGFPLAVATIPMEAGVSHTAMEAAEMVGDEIGYVLDGGASAVGKPATIIGIYGEDHVIYRSGAVSRESIEGEMRIPVVMQIMPLVAEPVRLYGR